MNALSRAGPDYGGKNSLRIVSWILASLIIIFYIDLITPLGLAVWILYFIPLFLTLHLEWRKGPFVVTGISIILIAASFFISPQDVSLVFALLNRVFFSLMLIALTLLIWNHKKSEVDLRQSEGRYRILVEWSPDPMVVYRNREILYTNPASLRFFGADNAGDVTSRDLLDRIQPASREIVRERINQAAMGAKPQIPDVGFLRLDGSGIRADLNLGEVYWDGESAVLLVARVHASQ